MREKSKVHEYFNEEKDNTGRKIYICTFCGHSFTLKNATKFARHLVNACKQCPVTVASEFKKDKENVLQEITPPQPQAHSSTFQETPSTVFDQDKAHRGFAKAIYVTGQPLSLLEHPLWIEALQNLKPDYKPLTRRLLASSLLTSEYEGTKLEIMEIINSTAVLHLAIDGWSNLRNESIMNIIIYTPKPFFYKFIDTKTNRHTAEYVCEKVSEVLEEIGSHKFFVIISDNAANMVKCGRLLHTKYANITWIGCLAHTLNLLIGDMIKEDPVSTIFSYVVKLVKCISKSHSLKAEFKKLSEDKSINVALALPVKTRWGSYLHCLENFLKAKVILQTLVISGIQELNTFKENVLNEAKWTMIENHIRLFKPIVHWITKLEGDYCTIHLVYEAITEIEELMNSNNADEILGQHLPQLRAKFLERKKNALHDIHFAAVILNPKKRGSSLRAEDHLEGCNAIMNLVSNADAANVIKELSDYKCRNGLYERNMIWQAANIIEPKEWWTTFFSSTALGHIAIKILTVPSTSASVERSFSTFSHIHTRKRNKLTTERAGKICYIAHNWKLMNEVVSPCSTERSGSSDITPDMGFTEANDVEISESDEDFDLEPVDFRSVTEVFEEEAYSDRFAINNEDDPLNFE